MQEYITNLFDQSNFPLWSAFLLGVITSLGPCTLTTNITAVGFISKDASGGIRAFWGGVIYTMGRAFTYTGIGVVLYLGANTLRISGVLAAYGDKIIGPLLLFIGLVMLDLISIPFPSFLKLTKKFEAKKSRTYFHDFLLGVVFALAFCSYSGVMYFGLLIPMTIASPSGLLLPLLFALGTGFIVILFSWLISFAFSGINKWFVRIRDFEFWLRKLVSVFFIGIGLYKTTLLLLAVF